MCVRLSEFLRATLNLAEEEIIPIEEEMALATTYLDVERVRFGSRLRAAQVLGAGCENCAVPSLILQPLVENAVKHGIAGLVEGGEIRLEADCHEGRLRVRVENEFDPDARSPNRNGVGLANVRNRLKTRYHNRARVTTEVRGRHFAVTLELPCDS
jgi:LytS/YehU family sensor histidine kinase